jgi:uncharacterized protein (TIGR00369 family)
VPLHADRFAPLPPEDATRWRLFNRPVDPHFPHFIGIVLEEVRRDYARFRLPFRRSLLQPADVVHGGAIATLIDTAVVPAIGSAFEGPRTLFTIDMHVQYMSPVAGEDAVAEAWVEKRGGSIVFCRAEVRTDGGTLAATGTLVYKVGGPRAA